MDMELKAMCVWHCPKTELLPSMDKLSFTPLELLKTDSMPPTITRLLIYCFSCSILSTVPCGRIGLCPHFSTGGKLKTRKA